MTGMVERYRACCVYALTPKRGIRNKKLTLCKKLRNFESSNRKFLKS